MYSFFVKNYLAQSGNSVVTEEKTVYSVPISSPEKLYQFTEPYVKDEIGKAGSFEFSILPNHPLYDAFLQMKTVFRVEYDGTTIFRGRVISIDNSWMSGERKIHAEGDLAYLLDSQQEGAKDDDRPEMTAAEYLAQLIGNHNEQMNSDPDKVMALGEVPGLYTYLTQDSQKVKTDVRKYGSSSWQSTMTALEELQKTFGGFFRTRYQNGTCYLDWLDNYFRPEVNGQSIELAKNLIDLSDTSDVDNIFTALIPIGNQDGESFYLPEKIVDVAAVASYFTSELLNSGYHSANEYLTAQDKYGVIVKVEQFRNADTEAKLREYAMDYIRCNFMGSMRNFTVSALDMHHITPSAAKILSGDRIRLVYHCEGASSAYGENMAETVLTVTAVTYYPHEPDTNEYSIGIPDMMLSKEYGTTTAKKLSNASSTGNYNFSSGISSLTDQITKASESFDLKKEVKSYDALAWEVVQNLSGNFYSSSRYHSILNSYPTANTDFQVERIAVAMLKNHMAAGSFGTVNYGPFTVTATVRNNSATVYPNVAKGVTATNAMLGVLPGIKEILELILNGYLSYIKTHPNFVGQGVPTETLSILDSSGFNLIASTGLGSIFLPSGVDINQNGSGYDISDASSIFTGLLSSLGISTENNILSESGMNTLLEKAKGLTSLIDTATKKFSVDKLLELLPKDLRSAVDTVGGTIGSAALNWLTTKIPILKYLVGAGQTALSISDLSNFISAIPLLSPDEAVSISSSGAITGSSLNVGSSSAMTVSQDGTITLTSGLASLLDPSTGHITKESFLKVFPKFENAFTRANPDVMSTAASNEVIAKFPEFADVVTANSKRLSITAMDNKIQQLIAAGKVNPTSSATASLNANTGTVSGTKVELGQDASGATTSVEIDGTTGTQKLGSDGNGNWDVVLNDRVEVDEPVTYTDENNVVHTLSEYDSATGKHYLRGTIKASDFSLPEIPSFRTKFAYIDYLFSDQIFANKITSLKATIGYLSAGDITAENIDLSGYVRADSLYVQNGMYAGYLNASSGISAPGASISCRYIYMDGTLYFVDNQVETSDPFRPGSIYFGTLSKTLLLRQPLSGSNVFKVGLQASVDQNNPGQITISFVDNTDGQHNTASFNIAATTAYLNGVAAARDSVYVHKGQWALGHVAMVPYYRDDENVEHATNGSASYLALTASQESVSGTLRVKVLDGQDDTGAYTDVAISRAVAYLDGAANSTNLEQRGTSYFWTNARYNIFFSATGVTAHLPSEAADIDVSKAVEYGRRLGSVAVIDSSKLAIYRQGSGSTWEAVSSSISLISDQTVTLRPSYNGTTNGDAITVTAPHQYSIGARSSNITANGTYYASADNIDGWSVVNVQVPQSSNPSPTYSGTWDDTGLNNVGNENTLSVSDGTSVVYSKTVYLSTYGNNTIVARENGYSGTVIAQIDSKYSDGWEDCVDNLSIRGGKVVNNSVPNWTLSNGGVKYLSSADDYYRVQLRYKSSSGTWQNGGQIDIGHAFLLAGNCQWRYYDEGSERWVNYNGGNVTRLYYANT